jgi:hypothetical protein
VLSSGAAPNMRKFPLLQTRRRRGESDNIEKSENQGEEKCKMITDNSRSEISQPSSNKTEKRDSSEDQGMFEKSLDDFDFFQIKDEVKNVLVTIVKSGDSKAMVKLLWKAFEFY